VLLGLDDPARMEALELGVLGADRSLVKAGALAAIYILFTFDCGGQGLPKALPGRRASVPE
jgi:hypothetical protein